MARIIGKRPKKDSWDFVTINENGSRTYLDVAGITEVERRAHDGLLYQMDRVSTIPSGSQADIGVITGSFQTHITFGLTTTENMDFSFYEDSIFTVNSGSELPVKNFNRNYLDNTDISFYRNPAVSNAGSLLSKGIVPQNLKNAGGIMIRETAEWVLEPNGSYVIRIKNTSSQTGSYSLSSEFAEETL